MVVPELDDERVQEGHGRGPELTQRVGVEALMESHYLLYVSLWDGVVDGCSQGAGTGVGNCVQHIQYIELGALQTSRFQISISTQHTDTEKVGFPTVCAFVLVYCIDEWVNFIWTGWLTMSYETSVTLKYS